MSNFHPPGSSFYLDGILGVDNTWVVNNPVTVWSRRKRIKVVVDIALLIGFLAEFITREGPDYGLHSWIGIALVPIIALHLTGSLGWISRVWNRRRQDRDFTLGVLNAVFGAVAGICIATGFPVWLEWSEASVWSTVHTVTGFLCILIMFIHLWMNRTRIALLARQ